MPAPARPMLPSGASIQSSGPVVDPAFTAAEFDVKAWINAALEAVPLQQQQEGNPDSNSKNGISPPLASHGDLKPSASVDASLDASLDLLQTPALDPVLDGKDQDDADSLVGAPPTSSSSGTSQQQQRATSITTKSQTSLLTQHATSHLTKLHLLASQTSSALASTTQDMVKLLPRLTHELDQLRQETKVLQEGIRLVRSDVSTVESSDTVQALDRLKYLDLVKTRMEATHSALREAENWRNLEAEAQEILAKGDFPRAATRLSEAERSLVVYKNTNVEGDRMALLRVLKDQLEQQVMGKVREALEQKDTVACQSLIAVFGLIGRQEKFQEYYIFQRRAPLSAQWKELFKNIHQGPRAGAPATTSHSAGDSKDFINALPKFYVDASNMLHDEFAWITSIFSDPSATIHNLVHDVFMHLDPTMQTALRDVARSQGDEGSLPLLIAAFVATESFGIRMERIVSQPLVGNLREHSPGSSNFPGRSRSGTLIQDAAHRDGKGAHMGRSSFSHEGLDIGSIHDPHEWAYILYEPFMVYQRDYGKLEGAHLRALLTTSIPAMATYPTKAAGSREISKASSHLVKIITNTNNIAFSLAEGAIGRCMRLTHGFGAPGLVDCLNGFFNDIMDRYTDILMECRQRSGLQVDGVSGEVKRQEDYGQNSRPSSSLGNKQSTPEDSEDSEGWDDDVNEQDQRFLHMGLRLIVLCRQLCLRLEQLDVKTKKSLRAVEHLIKSDAATHTGTNSDQGSSGSGLKLTAQPPNASIALLQQSNLNSYRLSEILEMVKKSATLEGQSGTMATNLGLIGDGISTLDRLSAETDLGLEPKPHHLFRQSHQRAVQLTKLCQRFIFDSIYIPLVRPLADVALLPCWTEGLDQQQGHPGDDLMGPRRIHQSTLGGTRTDVFRFRSGPSEYMEELLKQVVGLPLTLETYEGDAGLRFGIHALPYADKPFDQREQSEEAAGAEETALNSNEDGSEGRGVGESELDSGPLTQRPQSPEGQAYEEEDDVAVMHRWITSLLRAAMHTLIERLYDPNLGQVKSSTSTSTPPTSQRSRFGSPTLAPSSPSGLSGSTFGGNTRSASTKERHYLTRLSDSGAKQLELDLGHFVNTCLSSLAIEPTPNIRALIKALSMSEAGLLMAIHQQRESLENQRPQQKDGGEPASTLSSEPISIIIPGGPVLPSMLAIGDEESEEKQVEQELKIFEWVAQLKGIAASQP